MKWWNDKKVAIKIFGSFFLVTVLVIMVVLIGYLNVHNLSKTFRDNYYENTLPVEYSGEAKADLNRIRADVYYSILFPEKIDTTLDEINTLMVDLNEQIELMENLDLSQEDYDQISTIKNLWADYESQLQDMIDLVNIGNTTGAIDLLNDDLIAQIREDAISELDDLAERNINKMHENQGDVQTEAALIAKILVATGFIALVLSIVMGRYSASKYCPSA